MKRRTTFSARIAHLVGPGKVTVRNAMLAFASKDELPIRLDLSVLRQILCYGEVGISDEAFQVLFRHDIQVAWLSPGGRRCRGRLASLDHPGTSLRLVQHRRLASAAAVREYAAHLVAEKIRSQLRALRHFQRHGQPGARTPLERLRSYLEEVLPAPSLERLRGLEGNASQTWFGFFGRLLRDPFRFSGRQRRPPRDPVNALLSLGYTFLFTRAQALSEAAGLEIYLGTLHDFRPGRASLVCDLMEPLRVGAVDRWVVRLVNEGKLQPDHFLETPEGFRLQEAVFPRILQAWEEHWFASDQDRQLEAGVEHFVAWLRQGEVPEGGSLTKD